jgi:hypothetical protein
VSAAGAPRWTTLGVGSRASSLTHGDARGRDGGVREELAAGVVQLKPKTDVEATSILPSLNGKTARS